MTELARRLQPAAIELARLAQRRAAAGLIAFVVTFAILIFAVETLSQVGVRQSILIWLVAAFTLAVPAMVALFAPTVSRTEFAVAGRTMSVAANAAASATALFGSVFAVGLAALVFRSEAEMSALVLGLCGGCLLGGALLAPHLRRSAQPSLGDFLRARFGATVCAVSGFVAAVALFPMLVAELSVAGMIGSWTLGFSKDVSTIAVAILMLVPPLVGGMRGVSLAGVLQFTLLLGGLALGAFWTAAFATGYTLPIASYVAAAARLAAVGGGEVSVPSWTLAGLGLCVALAVAVSPALLMRSATTGSTQASRSSIAWTLLFVALFSIGSASAGAVARWLVNESPVRSSSIAELVAQPWIVEWVGRDASLVTLCGQPASEAGSACQGGALKPGDLAINPDIALLAAPQLAGAPTFFAVAAAAGCLAAAIGGGSLLLFAIGRSLGNDLLFRGIMPRAPASRRLLFERLVLILTAGCGFTVASDPLADYLRLALSSFSLLASGLFPVVLAAIWWPRANAVGATAGILVGFVIALFLVAADLRDLTLLGWLDPVGLAGLAGDLGMQRAALAAVPAALLTIVLVSLVTPSPPALQRRFADALRSPRDLSADDDE